MEDQFKEYGFTTPKYREISNLEGIKQGVIHELGVSIVSNFAIQQEIKYNLLVKVPIKGVQFQRGISYIYLRNKHLSPAANKFIPLLDNNIFK